MATYRYMLCDLLTDKPLAVVPLTGVSFERRISRVGSLQGALVAATRQQVELGRLIHAYAGRAALWVYRDNAIWWGGIPWTAVPTQQERGAVRVEVAAATFDSYPHHRQLREDLAFTQVDEAAIIHQLWDHLQADPRGDIGLRTDPGATTGTLRDRHYLGSDMHWYGELIENLGDVEGGPEHTIDVYEDGVGKRVKELRVAKRLGRRQARAIFHRARSGGGRVLTWEYAADAVDGGTTFQTRGDAPNGNVGEDKEPLLSSVHTNLQLLSEGWPLLDVVADHPGVKEQQTLEAHAAALQAQHSGALRTQEYVVQVGDTGWNPNRLGDAVRLKLRDLWHGDDDITARPVACKVTPPDEGSAERVRLIFGDGDS